MRLLFALLLCLAACASPREGTPDAAADAPYVDNSTTLPDADASTCFASGNTPCTVAGGVCVSGSCVYPQIDSGFREVDVLRVDVTEDRPAVVDAGADVPVDAGVCPNGRTATCDGEMVSLVNGVVDDAGVRHHCGACGVTCAANEGCVSCRCEL